ncbi:MAG: hypothetical protein Q7S84_03140 [bacterium]|nr:hypothetical protein [bacterium]
MTEGIELSDLLPVKVKRIVTYVHQMNAMNKRNVFRIAAVTVPIAGLVLFGAATVSAHGMFGSNATPDETASRQQTMFQNKASILGLSIDDVKNAWAKGQTVAQLAAAHGITADQLQQKLRDARAVEQKTRLQALVDKGVITQAQADQRTQFMQTNLSTQNGKSGRRGHGGMGMGMRGGFGL